MAKIIYTSYQTNSFKIIKSAFSIYELPHAPIIFLINLGILNCFENSDRAENFRQTVPIYGWWGGGGGCHLNFRHCLQGVLNLKMIPQSLHVIAAEIIGNSCSS